VRIGEALFGVLFATTTIGVLVLVECKCTLDVIPLRTVQNRIAGCDDLLLANSANSSC
jgi:hypothetical protein